MILLESLVLAALLIGFGHSWLRKHAGISYILAAAVAIAAIAGTWSGLFSSLPAWASSWIVPIFAQGGLAGALFIAVMFAAAVPNGSRFMRTVMPIRGELSILASILTLGHNIAYGRTYFVRLFTGADMKANVAAAAICSIAMIAIMLPLFITSFKAVRKKMKPKAWKKLQRLAYGFYGLLYVHVLLLNLPNAQASMTALVNVILYSILFIGYACMRAGKALVRKKKKNLSIALDILGAGLFIAICAFGFLPQSGTEAAGSAYLDGTYTGAGIGYNGRMTVAVTIEDGAITEIEVKSAVDDDPFFSNAVEGIIPAVLEAQSADVDAVSGASYSSAGLKEAISDALAAASGAE